MNHLVIASLVTLFLSVNAFLSTVEPVEEQPVMMETTTYSIPDPSEREYMIVRQEPHILATYQVTSLQDARRSSNGFTPLAQFIFGANEPSEYISMTAPVLRSGPESIAMTAPVTYEETDNRSVDVSFIMPSKWDRETLPVPLNSDITITEVPARTVAIIRFGGWGTDARMEEQEAILRTALEEAGIMPTSTIYARFSGPGTPFERLRNEVWMILDDDVPYDMEIPAMVE